MAASHDKEYPWYTVVRGSDIQQGDIINRCPILAPENIDDLEKEDIGPVKIYREPAIIMSQSCDLAPRKGGKSKIRNVVLCLLFDRRRVDETLSFDNKKWEDARCG